MSSIKGPTNSPNATITQDAVISQESTTPRRRVSLRPNKNIQIEDISNLKLENSITPEVSNETHKPIENIAMKSGIIPSSENAKNKELDKEYVNDKLGWQTTKIEFEPSTQQENVKAPESLKKNVSEEESLPNQPIKSSNSNEQENKIVQNRNMSRSTHTPSLERDLNVVSKFSKPTSLDKMSEVIGNKKISAKETYELNHDGTIFECIENRNIEDVDQNRLVFMRNGNIICPEGLHFSNHVQVKHADGSVRNLEFEKIYVLSRHEFASFIHPVLERLGEQSLKDKDSKDEKTTTNVNNQPSIHPQKNIKEVDPIMKKLLETKDELEFQDRNQVKKNSSIRSEKMKLQKEKLLNEKLSKIDDFSNEKKSIINKQY
jgi:hypothetical protein